LGLPFGWQLLAKLFIEQACQANISVTEDIYGQHTLDSVWSQALPLFASLLLETANLSLHR
jgi:hypothetical protein